MRLWFSKSGALPAILLLLAPGCGRDPFAPPTRLKSSSSTIPASAQKPIFIAMVVSGTPSLDVEIWAARAQNEANDKRAIFRLMGPAAGESSDLQPSIVLRAIQEGASALIVHAGNSAELPRVLAEAEAKGVPVILLDKDLAAPEGSKPFCLVEVTPPEESAKQLVAATIEDLKKAKRAVDGTALILADKVTDSTSAARVAALKSAAEAAKFPKVEMVPFDSSSEEAAKNAVVEAVKAHPDLAIVLVDDVEGMTGASAARLDYAGKPVFFVGGFLEYRASKYMALPLRESGFVEGRFSELGGLAVVTALKRLKGESVPRLSFVKPKFTRGAGVIGTGEDQAGLPPMPKANGTTDGEFKQPKTPIDSGKP